MTTNTSKVIALTGKAGVGKDTAALFFRDYYLSKGKTVTLLALADYPKQVTAKYFNIPIRYFNDRDKKDKLVKPYLTSPRQLLLDLWDVLFRARGEDFSLLKNIEIIDNCKSDIVIVTDVRFPIEFKWCKEESIPLIKIIRSGVEPVLHKSEMGDHYDFILDNNKSLTKLKKAVVAMIENEIQLGC